MKFNILWLLNPSNIPAEDIEDASEAQSAGSPVAEHLDSSIDDTLGGKAEAEAESTATTENDHVQQLRKLTDDEKVELSEIQARSVCTFVLPMYAFITYSCQTQCPSLNSLANN
jgi:hypothetical protein